VIAEQMYPKSNTDKTYSGSRHTIYSWKTRRTRVVCSKIPSFCEECILHWPPYCELISNVVENLVPLVRFLFFCLSRYNYWLGGRKNWCAGGSWKNPALNQERQVNLLCNVQEYCGAKLASRLTHARKRLFRTRPKEMK